MDTKQLADVRDTYQWHIAECERMLWVLKPGSKEVDQLHAAVADLRHCLDVFCELEEEKREN